MIALDTNLLVYAHRLDSPFHDAASKTLQTLVKGKARWAIPWPCVHEFVAVVTHPRIYRQPTLLVTALQAMQSLARLSNVQMLAEEEGYLERLEAVATAAKSQGGSIHDARIAALCLHHGILELWTADRDFSRFTTLRTFNPLVK